ncbi:sugar MFS transporter [Pandoraea nosoerga]|uniref:L-fucose-proton symporter n=2 Tax=Pandoraea nosoerga TaxID=2508296 RepID=A0A5E4VYN0_9BURK|nr:sugar MFS transporter [Pandoraea nosoerga]VVE16669.1 L-fucose-proton symporter [Pandoraea nosoerga]
MSADRSKALSSAQSAQSAQSVPSTGSVNAPLPAGSPSVPGAATAAGMPSASRVLSMLATLFFAMGLITSLNDILVPHFKAAFDLTYRDAALIQSSFFAAYFVVSYPAGQYTARVGYRRALASSLWLAGFGCALFFPAAALVSYACFLAALFVLASGITLLQVAVNAYVETLGSRGAAASRLTLVQAFNSLGTTVGPPLAALWILSPQAGPVAGHAVDTVRGPYGLLAAALVLGGIVLWRLRLPEPGRRETGAPEAPETPQAAVSAGAGVAGVASVAGASDAGNVRGLLAHRPLRYGIVALFLYVGAEVSIGSFLIVYLTHANTGIADHAHASRYLALYWGGAMVGRFVGAWLLRSVSPGRMLSLCAIYNLLLILASLVLPATLAMWLLLACGLGNAIMFPTIFSLSVGGLGARVSEGGGLICMAIVGGAVLPYLQGALADAAGVVLSFLVPAVAYAYIAAFGEWSASQPGLPKV